MMEKQVEEKSGSRILGLLYALIGSIIGALPWIFVYVFLEKISSILIIAVGIAALYGYILGNKDIDLVGGILIILISIFTVTISSYVFIPAIFMLQEGYSVSIDTFKTVYSYKPFMDALKTDYIKSMLFLGLGIVGFIYEYKKED